MYVLDKVSHPGWELRSNHIQHIRWMLEQHVCSKCKWTKEDYDKWRRENPEEAISASEDFELPEGMNPYTYNDLRPETYDQWSDLEKVEWLLDTACGCEFYFEEIKNESQTN